jgi:hypothetical protein
VPWSKVGFQNYTHWGMENIHVQRDLKTHYFNSPDVPVPKFIEMIC